MSVALAVDIGSSTVTVQVGYIKNGALSVDTVHQFPNHTGERDGRQIWDMNGLVEGVAAGVEQAKEQVDSIDTLGVDATAGDFGLLADGELLYEPYFYRDSD